MTITQSKKNPFSKTNLALFNLLSKTRTKRFISNKENIPKKKINNQNRLNKKKLEYERRVRLYLKYNTSSTEEKYCNNEHWRFDGNYGYNTYQQNKSNNTGIYEGGSCSFDNDDISYSAPYDFLGDDEVSTCF